MRKMIRLIMFICLASAVTNLYAGPSEKRFEGEWVSVSHKGDVDFGIHLHQDGNQMGPSMVRTHLPLQAQLKATLRSLTFTALIQM